MAVGVFLGVNEESVCTLARIGLGSVSPTPLKAYKSEEYLQGKKLDEKIIKEAALIAAEETRPRSRAQYRKEMSQLMVEQGLIEAFEKIKR